MQTAAARTGGRTSVRRPDEATVFFALRGTANEGGIRPVFFMPKAWMVLGILVRLGVAATLLGWRVRLHLLARRDPQLIAIFRRLESDHKAKRL